MLCGGRPPPLLKCGMQVALVGQRIELTDLTMYSSNRCSWQRTPPAETYGKLPYGLGGVAIWRHMSFRRVGRRPQAISSDCNPPCKSACFHLRQHFSAVRQIRPPCGLQSLRRCSSARPLRLQSELKLLLGNALSGGCGCYSCQRLPINNRPGLLVLHHVHLRPLRLSSC
jgi:hypothetical protein